MLLSRVLRLSDVDRSLFFTLEYLFVSTKWAGDCVYQFIVYNMHAYCDISMQSGPIVFINLLTKYFFGLC